MRVGDVEVVIGHALDSLKLTGPKLPAMWICWVIWGEILSQGSIRAATSFRDKGRSIDLRSYHFLCCTWKQIWNSIGHVCRRLGKSKPSACFCRSKIIVLLFYSCQCLPTLTWLQRMHVHVIQILRHRIHFHNNLVYVFCHRFLSRWRMHVACDWYSSISVHLQHRAWSHWGLCGTAQLLIVGKVEIDICICSVR